VIYAEIKQHTKARLTIKRYAVTVGGIVMNNLEQGECDKCEGTYDLGSRDNRCGDCGNCGNCCTHKEVSK
jgi:hypothetical protein